MSDMCSLFLSCIFECIIDLEDVWLTWFGQLGLDLGECVRRRSLYKL